MILYVHWVWTRNIQTTPSFCLWKKQGIVLAIVEEHQAIVRIQIDAYVLKTYSRPSPRKLQQNQLNVHNNYMHIALQRLIDWHIAQVSWIPHLYSSQCRL